MKDLIARKAMPRGIFCLKGRGMKNVRCMYLLMAIILFAVGSAEAHFGMIIPSDNMVMQTDPRTVSVTLSFSHPFELVGMALEKPRTFSVVANGKTIDLKETLKQTETMGTPPGKPLMH